MYALCIILNKGLCAQKTYKRHCRRKLMTKLICYYDNKTACAVRLDEQIFLAFLAEGAKYLDEKMEMNYLVGVL